MNRKILGFTLLVFFVLSCQFLYAKSVPPEIGTTKTFSSQNSIYSIDIKILGYPDNSPSECSLKQNNEILWTKQLPTTPGFVDISNDGNYFVLVNWGWYDEGGFKSISFYKGDGELLKTVELGGGLRWISKTCLSGNGKYYLIADRSSQVTLYRVATQTTSWDKKIGDKKTESDLNNILISQDGAYILISTFNHTTYNVHFSYLNREGKLLWEKEIIRGYSFNKNLIWLSEDGLNFKIRDLNQKKWLEFENNKNRIVLKKTSISTQ